MSVDNPLFARRVALCAAVGVGLAVAAPTLASAQPGYDRDGYDRDATTTSGVTVTAPRYRERDSATGAPIEWVSASRVVRYGDLDLSRGWGVRVLRARIARAARSACDQLDAQYPISAADNPPCVREAVREAMANSPIGEYADRSD